MEILTIINKLLEPETLVIILQIVIGILYLTGRITKSQFIIEQKKAQNRVTKTKRETRRAAAEHAVLPITTTLTLLDQLPILNTKLPFINASIPTIAKNVVVAPIEVISDIIFNFPLFGNNAKK